MTLPVTISIFWQLQKYSYVKYSYFIISYQLHVLLVALARTHGVTDEDFLWEFYILG